MALCVRMFRRVWNEIKSWYMRELVRDKGRLEDIIVGNDELVLLSEAKVKRNLKKSWTKRISISL